MLGLIKIVFGFFLALYAYFQSLPPDTREAVLRIIVEGFDAILRQYYRATKEEEKSRDKNHPAEGEAA